MDGLLIDSERVIFKALKKAGATMGLYDMESTIYKAIGRNKSDTEKLFIETYGDSFDFEQYYSLKYQYISDIIGDKGFPAKKGVIEILEYLKKNAIPFALCSSTRSGAVEDSLKKIGVYDYFDVFVCGDMGLPGKPNPDMFLKSATLLGVSPCDCYVLEDSINGIKAAYSAGMKPIMVPDMIAPNDEIKPMLYALKSDLIEVMNFIKLENLLEHKGFIFDLDGTLADSNEVWEKIDRLFLEKQNVYLDDDTLKKASAMTYEEVFTLFRKHGVRLSLQEIADEINALAIYEYAHNITLKAGAKELLKKLKACGKKIALATASPEFLYEGVLKNNGVYDLFDVFITTKEAGAEKDLPDIYIKASELLNVDKNDCIVFEDTLKTVSTSKKAGFFTVAIYDNASAYAKEDIEKKADLYLNDFTKIL